MGTYLYIERHIHLSKNQYKISHYFGDKLKKTKDADRIYVVAKQMVFSEKVLSSDNSIIDNLYQMLFDNNNPITIYIDDIEEIISDSIEYGVTEVEEHTLQLLENIVEEHKYLTEGIVNFSDISYELSIG